jgi:AcrR family transcriptional regulator
MKREDRRVRRTETALARALIELTLERGYDAVTIRDLTAQAKVGYATFFRHYPDKDALLHEVVDVVLEDLLAMLQLPAPREGGQKDGEVPAALPAAEYGTLIFSYVAQHPELTAVLLGTHRSHEVLRRLRDQGVRSVLEVNRPRPDATVPAEVAAEHIVTSTIALIRWWLEHGMPYPPERMGEINAEMIMEPALGLAFLPAAQASARPTGQPAVQSAVQSASSPQPPPEN